MDAELESSIVDASPVDNIKPPPIVEKNSLDGKLASVWNGMKCGDLVTGKKIITVNADDTLVACCKILASHGISSAPVLDGDRMCGLFDYRDLGAVIIKAFSQHSEEKKNKK